MCCLELGGGGGGLVGVIKSENSLIFLVQFTFNMSNIHKTLIALVPCLLLAFFAAHAETSPAPSTETVQIDQSQLKALQLGQRTFKRYPSAPIIKTVPTHKHTPLRLKRHYGVIKFERINLPLSLGLFSI